MRRRDEEEGEGEGEMTGRGSSEGKTEIIRGMVVGG